MKGRTMKWACAAILLAFAGCAAILLVFAGWAEEGTGIPVSGAVTRNGDPVEAGKIHFIPTKGTQGPAGGGDIEDGRYRVERSHGLQPGSYKVKVTLASGSRDRGLKRSLETHEFNREITADNPRVDLELPQQQPALANKK